MRYELKNEVINGIKAVAELKGFKAEDNKDEYYHEGLPEIKSEVVIFFLDIHHSIITGECKTRSDISFGACVRSCGGEPTTEELRKTAEEITRACDLVDTLNELELAYYTIYEDEEGEDDE